MLAPNMEKRPWNGSYWDLKGHSDAIEAGSITKQ
jgi:hypothetical protein